MKSYPAYKDSGIEWIGDIPVHWAIIKQKYRVKVLNGYAFKSEEYVEEGIPVIRIGDISNEIDLSKCKRVDSNYLESAKSFLIERDDILLALTGATIGKSSVYLSDEEALLNQRVAVLRGSNEVCQHYIAYIISSYVFRKYIDFECGGSAQENIGKPQLDNYVHCLPPLEEQTAIANFLDHKTAQLDAAIEKHRQLIELLQEHRAALINEAVTKGLDPSAPMQDSGVEWIGEVPAGWEVVKLRWLISEPLKYGANQPARDNNPENPRYIRITDFGDDGKLRDNTFRSLPMSIAKDYLLEEGDILFARSGATVGKTFQFSDYDSLACFAGYLIKASPSSDKILSDYLYFYTRSGAYENWKNSIFIQATIQNIGADKYKTLPVSLPDIDQQRKIVAYINAETTRIDAEIAATEREIELLREYRQALIAEAVTGKIDVRGWEEEAV